MMSITDDHYKSKVEIKTVRTVIQSYRSDIHTEKKNNNFLFIKIIMMYQHTELVMVLYQIIDALSTGSVCLFFNVNLHFLLFDDD